MKRKRQTKKRELLVESLEERMLLAVGPQLLGINPNEGEILQNNDVRHVAPTVLTFRFDSSQQINETTLDGIRLTSSGGDGTFAAAEATSDFDTGGAVDITFTAALLGQSQNGITIVVDKNDLGDTSSAPTVTVLDTTITVELNTNVAALTTAQDLVDAINGDLNASSLVVASITTAPGSETTDIATPVIIPFAPIVLGGANDVEITPGHIGIGDSPNEVVMRFAETLPDEVYRIDVIGTGNTPLKNITGDPFDADPVAAGIQNENLVFELDLGAQIVAVVPQPVFRDMNTGVLDQARDTIVVYFNDDDLDPASAEDVDFYQLIFTNDTVTNTDDVAINPIAVAYDSVTDTAVLTFSDDLENLATGTGVYRLRIGTDIDDLAGDPTLPPPPVTTNLIPADTGSSFGAAFTVGTLTEQSLVFNAEIEAQLFELDFPGADNEPGHRDIPVRQNDHLELNPDEVQGITTIFYNFRADIGFDPFGNPLFNSINEEQKQRTREAFELMGSMIGAHFVESDFLDPNSLAANEQQITIARGDIRAVIPNVPTGVGGIVVVIGDDIVVMDNAEDWDDSFGLPDPLTKDSWFTIVMLGIERELGIGSTEGLPPTTITQSAVPSLLGFDNPLEPVFPGDHDIVHLQHLFRPESKDIDLYKFEIGLGESGLFTAETIAERQASASLLDSNLRLYKEDGSGNRELIASNDDYFSSDSFLELELGTGTYYVGVSASGNDSYDPTIEDSGIGGTSQGVYELRLNFRPEVDDSIVDTGSVLQPGLAATALDGDADGIPGGVFNFWFQVQTTADTFFVDKVDNDTSQLFEGTLANPFNDIEAALVRAKAIVDLDPNAHPIVRIVGNARDSLGNFLNDGVVVSVVPGTVDPANVQAYEIGTSELTGGDLADGSTIEVSRNVTVMIDAGAVFKLRRARIGVGSSAVGIDRSGGALQVLGAPDLNVIFTSIYDDTAGQDTDAFVRPALQGDWGGLRFRSDLDHDQERFTWEDSGIFLDHVNQADLRFGGGDVRLGSKDLTVAPIDMFETRPTIAYNTISNSAFAAISADPDSFLETNFQTPFFQLADPFTSDYDRVGPNIHGNRLVDNQMNGLFINIQTVPGAELLPLTVAGRWDDTDIVHIVNENLIVNGTPGGAVLDAVVPPVTLVELTAITTPAGSLAAGDTYNYRVVFVDADSNEGRASAATANVTLGVGNNTVVLENLPVAPSGFVAKRIYRSDATGNGPYTLVAEIDTTIRTFVDNGTTAGGVLVDTPDTFRARLDARLAIDPGTIVKLDGARIETGMGAQLLAEGTAGLPIVFTSLNDDRYGAGGTFDTNNNGSQTAALPGDWGGIYIGHTGSASFDHAVFAYAGGITGVGGSFAGFNALEIHQAKARVTNSVFEHNASGVGGQAPLNRLGKGFNEESTLFVRGAQPIIVSNIFRNNNGAAISINANALNSDLVVDLGRSTGASDRFDQFDDNQGALVRLNRIADVDIQIGFGGGVSDDSHPDSEVVDPILFGESRLVIGPHHTDPGHGGSPNTHFFAETGDAHHFAWQDNNLATPDVIDIWYDFRDQGGFANVITPGQILNAETALQQWSAASGGAVSFTRNTTTAATNIVNIGTGDLAALGSTSGPGGVLGLGGGFFTHDANHTITGGVAWQDSADTWDETIGNGDPPNTFDYFTVVAQEIGHAIGLGHTNNLPGPDIMDGSYVGEQPPPFSANDAAHIQAIYGGSGVVDVINGLVVRGETLTTESVWDDTDIVHVLLNDTVYIPDLHSFGGLRLESSSTESLVVKLEGPNAGFTATGRPLDIDDRIGGAVHIVGQPGRPVVLTSLKDDTVGAGFTPEGNPQTDTNNDSDLTEAAPGDWRSVRIDQFSNDRNVEIVNEFESSGLNAPGSNADPDTAQFLGFLAPDEKGGDDNRRLGFQVHGFINEPNDVDVYSFDGIAGTEVWIDIDRTTQALDVVVELVDQNGNVIVRSDNSTAENDPNSPENLFIQPGSGVTAHPLQKSLYNPEDQGTINPRDAGFRVILPGTNGNTNTYDVRVRSSSGDLSMLDGGLTSGVYQLQIRLGTLNEFPGSTVRFADIRFATNGIEVLGMPGRSPLLTDAGEANSTANNNRGGAQDLGNLLNTDLAALGIAGNIDNIGDVDFYRFEIFYDSAVANAEFPVAGTIFDLDYADGFSRANTELWVFDSTGRLILRGTDSNIAEDRPAPLESPDIDDLSRGSAGSLDPFIGTVALPARPENGDITRGAVYYVAVTANSIMPQQLQQFLVPNPANTLIRLEPIDSLQRIGSDHADFVSDPIAGNPQIDLFDDDLASNLVPFHLGDVVLYIASDGPGVGQTSLDTFDPFTGFKETDMRTFASDVGDIVMIGDTPVRGGTDRIREELVALSVDEIGPVDDAPSGNYFAIQTDAIPGQNPAVITNADGFTQVDDGITTYIPGSDGTVVPNGGVGIQFNAMAVRRDYQNGLSGRAIDQLFAIGVRGDFALVPVPEAGDGQARNILYVFNPDTGQALSQDTRDRRTNANAPNEQGRGAATEVVERGILDTVDAFSLMTGAAFVNGFLYVVDDAGWLYKIVSPFSNTVPGHDFNTGINGDKGNGAQALPLLQIEDPNLPGSFINFQGLATGPQRTEVDPTTGEGRYSELLFGISFDGDLYAIDPIAAEADPFTSPLQPVFVDGAVTVATGQFNVRGLDFSSLQENPWRTSTPIQRRTDDGHGLLLPANASRIPISEFEAANSTINFARRTSTRNIDIDYPGGAHGSLVSNTFSLADYSAADVPVLYFNYFLETEGINHNPDINPAHNRPMRDVLRVSAAGEDGVWHLLATNDSFRSDARFDEFDLEQNFRLDQRDAQNTSDFASITQELFDINDQDAIAAGNAVPNSWRQARVDLADFAGQENLQLRFDFSTAGTLNVGDANTVGDELRVIAGSRLRDGQTFTLGADRTRFNTFFDGVVFEFNMGHTIVAPTGNDIVDGDTISVSDGTNPVQVFEFHDGVGAAPANAIIFDGGMTPNEVADAIRAAIQIRIDSGDLAGIDLYLNDNRLNVKGAANVTSTLGGILEGSAAVGGDQEVDIHAGMSEEEVAAAVVLAMAKEFGTAEISPGVKDDISNVATIPTFGNLVRVIGHTVEDEGPLTLSRDSFFGSAGLTGDTFGTFFTTRRSAANQIEGVYIDDIVIGFAERGEIVTGASANASNFVVNPRQEIFEIETGQYQLEIRRGAEYGTPIRSDFSRQRLFLDRSFDTNDRLTEQISFLAPAGADISDGELFTLGDGVNSLVFEFVDVGVDALAAPGNVPILFHDEVDLFTGLQRFESDTELAVKIVAAINSDAVQDVLDISAALSDGTTVLSNGTFIGGPNTFIGSTTNSNVINLFGNAVVQNKDISGGNTGVEAKLHDVSTFRNDVFEIQNTSLAGERISSVEIVLPAGFSYFSNFLNVSFRSDLVGDLLETFVPIFFPDTMKIEFTDFDPGEQFIFGAAVLDPTFVFADGSQLVGSQVLIEFDSGRTVAGNYRAGVTAQAFAELPFEDVRAVVHRDFGDRNRHRDQGQIVIQQNLISDSAGFGIVVDAGQRTRNDLVPMAGSLAHPGITVNTPQLNLDRLVPGVTIENNVVARGLQGGIQLSGDPNAGGETASVPFSRVVNNTIVGLGGDLLLGKPTDESNDTLATAVKTRLTPTNPGTYSDTGTIGDNPNLPVASMDVDLFEFELGAFQNVTIDIDANEFGIGINPFLRVFDATGTSLDFNDNQTAPGELFSFDPFISFTPFVEGTYFVGVSTVANTAYNPNLEGSGRPALTSGDYTITITVAGTPVPPPTDVGIEVNDNASPTLLNNIVANLNTGVQVDGTSTSTVLAGMLFQGNLSNNAGVGQGDFPIANQRTDPLFVDIAAGNYILAEGSLAINSSVEAIEERLGLVSLKGSLGIDTSPILAPDRDATGQLRVADASGTTGGGTGSNVFKDRGALDRSDFVGPSAVLENPLDNDAAGVDLDATTTVVKLDNNIVLNNFAVRIADGFESTDPRAGSGVDDGTVLSNTVTVAYGGQTLEQGVDYTFGYNPTNDTILLTPLSGIWLPGDYLISLANTDGPTAQGIRDVTGNLLRANQAGGETQFTILIGELDFGDAPDPLYPTKLSNDGARHVVADGFFLGSLVDTEQDGQPNGSATGDDVLDGNDDEDGVVFGTLTAAETATITVTASTAGRLDAWIDFDGDGIWEVGEQIFTNQQLNAGANVFTNVAIPSTAIAGTTYARFRLSSTGGLDPTGLASDGEVEDYQITILPPNTLTNPANPFDVNNDGFVDNLDVFVLIDDFRLNGTTPTGRDISLSTPPPFIDVNDDDAADALDIIALIDFLRNPGGSPEGEGEALAALADADGTADPITSTVGGGEGEFAVNVEVVLAASATLAAPNDSDSPELSDPQTTTSINEVDTQIVALWIANDEESSDDDGVDTFSTATTIESDFTANDNSISLSSEDALLAALSAQYDSEVLVSELEPVLAEIADDVSIVWQNEEASDSFFSEFDDIV